MAIQAAEDSLRRATQLRENRWPTRCAATAAGGAKQESLPSRRSSVPSDWVRVGCEAGTGSRPGRTRACPGRRGPMSRWQAFAASARNTSRNIWGRPASSGSGAPPCGMRKAMPRRRSSAVLAMRSLTPRVRQGRRPRRAAGGQHRPADVVSIHQLQVSTGGPRRRGAADAQRDLNLSCRGTEGARSCRGTEGARSHRVGK
jgi:hypothetical protein